MAKRTLNDAKKPRKGRPPKPVDQSTYSGRFAARLRELRERRELSVADLRDHLEDGGVKVVEETIRSWERNASTPPLDVFPVLARILYIKIGDMMPPQ
ncbi:hypothetical protein [Alienimonas sp. DA493]|uniref:hypothetical protein n=1 Tax=Alienimonas sp. DA493 TaxID=3373605 RepID=UPI003754020F